MVAGILCKNFSFLANICSTNPNTLILIFPESLFLKYLISGKIYADRRLLKNINQKMVPRENAKTRKYRSKQALGDYGNTLKNF